MWIMRHFPSWVYAVLGRRMDGLEQLMSSDQLDDEKESALFQQFWNTLSPEQRQLYNEWEEQHSPLLAKRKENFYMYGFLDGIHVFSVFSEQNSLLNELGYPNKVSSPAKGKKGNHPENNACDESGRELR